MSPPRPPEARCAYPCRVDLPASWPTYHSGPLAGYPVPGVLGAPDGGCLARVVTPDLNPSEFWAEPVCPTLRIYSNGAVERVCP